jgi:hypothetical protein
MVPLLLLVVAASHAASSMDYQEPSPRTEKEEDRVLLTDLGSLEGDFTALGVLARAA